MQEVRKKIVLLGNIGVGKTSLVKQFVHQKFSDEYLSTIGVRVDMKKIVLKDAIVHLMIWDLAGEILSNKQYHKYIKGASGIFAVFDVTREKSFTTIQQEIEEINETNKDLPTILVGNKIDLIEEHNLTMNQVKTKYPCSFYTSAKTGNNVESAFKRVSELLLKPIKT